MGEMINLTPIQGNIHAFTAIQDTVIFDILTPYYDQEIRFCNFYKEIDGSKPNKPTKPPKKSQKKDKEFEPPKEEELKLKGKGEKTTVVYLYQPPKINFQVIPVSPNLLD
jgi:PCO_ADO